MSSTDYPAEDKLRQAAEFIRTGRLSEARLLLREILIADRNNLTAWELLFHVAHTDEEKIFCLKALLTLSPDHPWARAQLAEINPGAIPEAGPVPSNTAPARTAPSARTVTQEKPRGRKPAQYLIVAAVLLAALTCIGVIGLALARAGVLSRTAPADLTATALAAHDSNCQALIQQAVQASGSFCHQVGSNKVCYGNATIQADLIPSSPGRFVQPGDVVDISLFRSLSASPLILDTHQWGIAVFKVLANLPHSLPGETVTLLVFGNTTVDSASGSLEAFHFTSQFGQIVCNKVNLDGITINVPKGQGRQFTVNGAQLTVMGNASLKATKNGKMQVSLYSGAGRIVSQGKAQTFGAGQKVSVQLGGPNGSDSVSPPSTPEPLSPDELALACSMGGQYCSQSAITPVSPDEAEALIDAGLATSTPTATSTSTPTATITQTTTPSPSSTTTGSPSQTVTLTATPTRTLTPTPSRTLTRTASRTPANTYTPTRTQTSTNTFTPTYTYTPANTFTPTDTDTSTDTFTPTDTYTPTDTFAPTDTYTSTNTSLPTATATPLPIQESILDPTGNPTISNPSQTAFEAWACDPNVLPVNCNPPTSGNGNGIQTVEFWFSTSLGADVPGLPSASAPHIEYSIRYCAFGGTLNCGTMNGAVYSSLSSGDYIMYVQAFATSGQVSAIEQADFTIP